MENQESYLVENYKLGSSMKEGEIEIIPGKYIKFYVGYIECISKKGVTTYDENSNRRVSELTKILMENNQIFEERETKESGLTRLVPIKHLGRAEAIVKKVKKSLKKKV